MNKILNLQDVFLNQARKDKIPVTIYLTNGFQFKGIVRGFDNYVVILDCEGKQNLFISMLFPQFVLLSLYLFLMGLKRRNSKGEINEFGYFQNFKRIAF